MRLAVILLGALFLVFPAAAQDEMQQWEYAVAIFNPFRQHVQIVENPQADDYGQLTEAVNTAMGALDPDFALLADTHNLGLITFLNTTGAMGWEMVSVTCQSNRTREGTLELCTYYFKRPKLD